MFDERGAERVDKKRLTQYKALEREKRKLQAEIGKLYDKLENVPVVLGKVKGSSKDFPYIEQHVTVQMAEPRTADENARKILEKKKRLRTVEAELEEIRTFVAGIEDATTRQIFEMAFLEGKKQREIADELAMERSNVSKKISGYLQLSHNSHF